MTPSLKPIFLFQGIALEEVSHQGCPGCFLERKDPTVSDTCKGSYISKKALKEFQNLRGNLFNYFGRSCSAEGGIIYQRASAQLELF